MILKIISKKYIQKIITEYNKFIKKNRENDFMYWWNDNDGYTEMMFSDGGYTALLYDDEYDNYEENYDNYNYDDYNYYLEKKHLGVKKINKIIEDLEKQKDLEKEKKLNEIENCYCYLLERFSYYKQLYK